LGLADLLRAFEELHHDHVLAFRGDLDDPVGSGRRDPYVVEQQKGVVLVLDEPADRLEGSLTLEGPVSDCPAQLVGPIRANMALRVDLGEEEALRLPFGRCDAQADRGGASRSFQSDRLHLEQGKPELILDGLADRLAPSSTDVEVSSTAPSVGHGEYRVWREEAEGDHGYPCSQDDSGHVVRQMVDGQVDACE